MFRLHALVLCTSFGVDWDAVRVALGLFIWPDGVSGIARRCAVSHVGPVQLFTCSRVRVGAGCWTVSIEEPSWKGGRISG